MYDNEFETKENKILTKDKIEPQHRCNSSYNFIHVLTCNLISCCKMLLTYFEKAL